MKKGETSVMKLSSPSFAADQLIPEQFTCDGDDVSPALEISEVPSEAKSLVFIVDDPDSPSRVWVHWTMWNIPATTTEIAEGEVPLGTMEGINDFGKIGYGGPCPSFGLHHYHFQLYALDTKLELPAKTTASELKRAMTDHILAEAQLIGLYSR